MMLHVRIISTFALGVALVAGGLATTSKSALARNTAPQIPTLTQYKTSQAKGEALAKFAEAFGSGWADLYIKATLTLYDSSGNSVERSLRETILERQKGNKSLFRFLGPAGIRGVSVLVHEHPHASDESWLYLPSSRRVRRISGANRSASFQGTEFAYEDLSTFKAVRYQWDYIGRKVIQVDGKPVETYVLGAKPRSRDTDYSLLKNYLNPETGQFVRVEFFDKAGRHLKTVTGSNYKKVHGRFYRALRLEMKNVQNGRRTVFETKVLMLDLARYKDAQGNPRSSLSEQDFTRRELERL